MTNISDRSCRENQNIYFMLDFKLSPCSECFILSSGQFPGELPRRKHKTLILGSFSFLNHAVYD